MSIIIRPITEDKLVGFDQFNQMVHEEKDEDHTVSRMIADVREKICGICNHGWAPTGPSMGDQHYWDLIGHVHETCFIRWQAINEKRGFYLALIQAGIKFETMDPIRNQYWPEGHSYAAKPWYEVKVFYQPIMLRMGKRKRVNHIEAVPLDGLKFTNPDLAEAFFNTENVTKEFSSNRFLIHSYSEEDDLRYLRGFTTVLKLQEDKPRVG